MKEVCWSRQEKHLYLGTLFQLAQPWRFRRNIQLGNVWLPALWSHGFFWIFVVHVQFTCTYILWWAVRKLFAIQKGAIWSSYAEARQVSWRYWRCTCACTYKYNTCMYCKSTLHGWPECQTLQPFISLWFTERNKRDCYDPTFNYKSWPVDQQVWGKPVNS